MCACVAPGGLPYPLVRCKDHKRERERTTVVDILCGGPRGRETEPQVACVQVPGLENNNNKKKKKNCGVVRSRLNKKKTPSVS